MPKRKDRYEINQMRDLLEQLGSQVSEMAYVFHLGMSYIKEWDNKWYTIPDVRTWYTNHCEEAESIVNDLLKFLPEEEIQVNPKREAKKSKPTLHLTEREIQNRELLAKTDIKEQLT